MFLTKLVSSFRRNVALKCLPTTSIQRSKDVELNAAFCCLFFTFYLLCQRFPLTHPITMAVTASYEIQTIHS